MLPALPNTLFVQGEPLRAAAWNRLVDASVEMREVWGAEHLDGERHASARLESAALLLEWTGSTWGTVDKDRISVTHVQSLGDRFAVSVAFDAPLFLSALDYAVLAQGDDGVPCIVTGPSKTASSFTLIVPSGAGAPAPKRISVVVFGRERGA